MKHETLFLKMLCNVSILWVYSHEKARIKFLDRGDFQSIAGNFKSDNCNKKGQHFSQRIWNLITLVSKIYFQVLNTEKMSFQ